MLSQYLVQEANLQSPKLLPGQHLLQAFNHTSKPGSVKGFIQALPACPISHRKPTFTNAFSLHQTLFVYRTFVATGI